MKKLLYIAGMATVAFTAVVATPHPGSTQEVDNPPPPRELGERQLVVNPLTGHIYCVVLGSGCIVH
ncbi:MAG TPA: hypothetical protein VE913_14595 [Longimicrobium sp.]|nr:hypothetical protein [Longimicrobium sp.]